MFDFLPVFDITYADMILLVVSFIIGMLISWLFSKIKIGNRDDYIEELEDSIKSKDKNLKDLNKTPQR
jgi:hypothetical protein